jgi:hypothetical protein
MPRILRDVVVRVIVPRECVSAVMPPLLVSYL